MTDRASASRRRVLPPERLAEHHDLSTFVNGKHLSLDEWLRKRARGSEGLSARTYVVCAADEPSRVVGYYAIAAGMEQRLALPNAKLRHGMPEHIPLLLIGRLAIDPAYRGIGLGRDLVVDALTRCLAASEIAGARAIIAHALDDEAVRFYVHHGFVASPLGPRVMLMPVEWVRALLDGG